MNPAGRALPFGRGSQGDELRLHAALLALAATAADLQAIGVRR